MELHITGDNKYKHICNAEREGDVITFTCNLCPDYKKTINIKTEEVKTESDEDNNIPHTGSYTPPGLDQNLYTPN